MLRLELTELQEEDYNLDIMGFSEDELDKLLAPMSDSNSRTSLYFV